MDVDDGTHGIRREDLLHLVFVRSGVVAKAESRACIALAIYFELVGDPRCVGESVSALSGGGSAFFSLFLEF